ncbi:acyl-CoA thioesterase [Neptunicella sp. SCSIO 80796]|uniref:acyl-CoA thioesterase n=1 Tax=Neptunicella plasticusilytica TaxID=3117012 RepID=UPI003A4DE761
MSKSLPRAKVCIDVPFFDIDAMNVVWHGHYVKYLEVARCELLRSFDYDYPQMKESGFLWPIVDLRIKYVGSARFANKIWVEASLQEYENRLRIDYLITDAASGDKLTKATSIQVAVCADSGEMQYVSPAILLEKLGLQ